MKDPRGLKFFLGSNEGGGGNRSQTTDYLYIGDQQKKSSRIPPARLLSPDRADMDCGIDRLSREI